jgi:hypothetical protein
MQYNTNTPAITSCGSMGYAGKRMFTIKHLKSFQEKNIVQRLTCTVLGVSSAFCKSFVTRRILKEIPKRKKNDENLPILNDEHLEKCGSQCSAAAFDFI